MKRTVADVYLPVTRGMKSRAISQVIHKKMDSWLESLPPELAKQIKPDIIVTGGCIASMLMGDEPNDFDVYMASFDSAEALAKHYVDQYNAKGTIATKGTNPVSLFVESVRPSGDNPGRVYIYVKSAGVVGDANQEQDAEPYRYFEGDPDPTNAENFINETARAAEATEQAAKDEAEKKNGYSVLHMSGNAITLWGKVQVVIRFFGPPAEIHRNYDFVHVTNHWTFEEGLVLRAEALEAILSKTLVYQGSLYPICSLIRLRKFIARGWNVTAGQILKMVWQVNDLNLQDANVLRDQLMGVDAAYFAQLLSILTSDRKKNPNLTIDAAYIAILIDKFLD